ncbi:MAG: hypothetical protein V7609_2749 [Verrucomicrobiota bacterium]
MHSKTTTGCRLFGLCAILCQTAFAQDALEIQLGPKLSSVRENRRAAVAAARSHEAVGRKVRYVKVEGLWARDVKLPLAPGDVLTPDNLSDAVETLQTAIHQNSSSNYGLQSRGEFAVLYITTRFDTSQSSPASSDATVEPGSVGVIFRPHYVHLSLVEIGDNVLPIPRTPYPTFYDNMPEALRVLRPVVALTHDRAFGTAIFGSFNTDLSTLSAAADGIHHFEIRGQGLKSLEERYYRADIGLRFGVQRKADRIQEFALSADFNGADEPFGDGNHERQAGVGAIALKLKIAPNTRLWLEAGYRRTDDRVRSEAIADTDTSANEQTGRLLLEAIPPSIHGFLRAAIWEEAGWQTGSGGAYQRLAGRIGYEKELSIAENQSIGIEIIAGGGKTFGDRPPYVSFFGGNSDSKFLYDRSSSPALSRMASGPIIRSFGENEAGLRDGPGRVIGGDTFWHVNLNVALPIPFLSRSLIPNESADIEDENGNPMSIKQVLLQQIDVTGPSMLIATLKKQGLSQEEATTRAHEILQEIRPAAHYIIRDANLYSIKPLLMVDAAGLSGPGASSETWLAVGGGLQLTVVTAKFEAGYMRTISGPTFGHEGNFFARLVFQNLF